MGVQMNHYIELKDLSKYYYSKEVVSMGLRKINLKLDLGEFVAVVGESGSGKSTLMNVISGMDTYEEGEMYFQGEETSCYTGEDWNYYRKDNIAFIFQDYNLIDSYTVLQNVELALLEIIADKKLRRERALSLIDRVGLSGRIKHKCIKLSGGEKQRVSIARALAKDAPIIIADEPCGNLDEETTKSIIKLLSEVSRDKLLIMVTHSFNEVEDYATRRIRLYDGTIESDKIIKPVEILTPKPIYSPKALSIKNRILNSLHISFNNTLATPKKTIFVLSTYFLVTFLTLLFFMFSHYLINMNNEKDNWGNRKDSALVYREDGALFDESEREAILGIDGVEAAMINYNTYSLSLICNDIESVIENKLSTSFVILNVANFNKDIIEYGNKPVNDNEILLSFQGFEKPNPDAIGKTSTFIIINNNGKLVEKDFVISGFTSGEGCYITTSAIEALSMDMLNSLYDKDKFQLYVHNVSFNTEITRDRILLDSEVESNKVVIIYNEDHEYEGEINGIKQYLNLINKCNIRSQSFRYNNNFDVIISSNVTNSYYYDKYYNDGIIFAFGVDNIIFDRNQLGLTNSAQIVFDEDINIKATIDRLSKSVYKVHYYYNPDRHSFMMENIIILFFIGSILVGLSMVMGYLIVKRLMYSRRKDYNILRTVGIDSNVIRAVSYLDYILPIITVIVFVFMTLNILSLISIISHNYRLYNILNFLAPIGFFKLKSLWLFFLTFSVIVIEAILIIRRGNKKFLKISIKKLSLLEE